MNLSLKGVHYDQASLEEQQFKSSDVPYISPSISSQAQSFLSQALTCPLLLHGTSPAPSAVTLCSGFTGCDSIFRGGRWKTS